MPSQSGESEHSEKFSRELENIKTKQRLTMEQLKYKLQQKESTADEMIHRGKSVNWKTVVEITQSEQKKKEKKKKMNEDRGRDL